MLPLIEKKTKKTCSSFHSTLSYTSFAVQVIVRQAAGIAVEFSNIILRLDKGLKSQGDAPRLSAVQATTVSLCQRTDRSFDLIKQTAACLFWRNARCLRCSVSWRDDVACMAAYRFPNVGVDTVRGCAREGLYRSVQYRGYVMVITGEVNSAPLCMLVLNL